MNIDNKTIEKFIAIIVDKLPDKALLSSKDLVDLGICSSNIILSTWRRNGDGPPYFKISKGKIRYPREAFIEWIRNLNGLKE